MDGASTSTFLGTWIAALLTIGILTFLYRDNIIYKITEAIFVGVSAGYWFITLFWDNIWRKFIVVGVLGTQESDPQHILWGGVVLGVMMLFRLSRRIGWIARWPLSFIVGAVAGLYMMLYFTSNLTVQVSETIRSVIWSISPHKVPQIPIEPTALDVVGSIIIAVGVFCGLSYFYFSKEHKGAFGGLAKVGIWFIMITFGASFGYTVMSRMSLLIGRIDFLLKDWLELI
jgi:hypothetical protein